MPFFIGLLKGAFSGLFDMEPHFFHGGGGVVVLHLPQNIQMLLQRLNGAGQTLAADAVIAEIIKKCHLKQIVD